MATLIKVNGAQSQLKDTNLKTLQDAVGGYIEYAQLADGKVLVVNEEGLLKKNQKVNYTASKLYGSTIVGDAVLCNYSELK